MEKHIRTARFISTLLDSQFEIGDFRFGLDPVFGLVPWIGDFFSALLSSYIIWVAYEMEIPTLEIIRMIFYVILDFFLGIIPIIGDIADFYYKANKKNLKILEKYIPKNFIEGEIVK